MFVCISACHCAALASLLPESETELQQLAQTIHDALLLHALSKAPIQQQQQQLLLHMHNQVREDVVWLERT